LNSSPLRINAYEWDINFDGEMRIVSGSGMTATMAYKSISAWSGALGVCALIAIVRPAHAEPRAVI